MDRSLKLSYPAFAAELVDADPMNVSLDDDGPFWWRCPVGDLYRARIAERIHRPGCPVCATAPGVSVAEARPDMASRIPGSAQLAANSTERVSLVCVNGHRSSGVVRELVLTWRGCRHCHRARPKTWKDSVAALRPRLALEWNGQANGYLGPGAVLASSLVPVAWRCARGHRFTDAPATRARSCPTCAAANEEPLLGHRKPMSPLSERAPEVASWWHPTRNQPLTPDEVGVGSRHQLWWRCPRGHEFQSSPLARMRNPGRCPRCSRLPQVAQEQSLAATRPQLAAEFDPVQDIQLTAHQLGAGSTFEARWVCPRGHRWRAKVAVRANGYRGCPQCTGGTLEEIGGHVLASFDAAANAPLTPSQVHARWSDALAWHRSKCGHSWVQPVIERMRKPARCPVCDRRVLVAGVNDLASQHPEATQPWHPHNDVGPEQTFDRGQDAMWWLCVKGHQWRESVDARLAGGGCPRCAGDRARSKATGAEVAKLIVARPELAAQWVHEANEHLHLPLVTVGSNAKATWRCSVGHTWEASVSNRARNGSNCPRCRQEARSR